MKDKLLLVLLVMLLGIAGCPNQVPVAENFSLSTQKKLRAPHHWDVIAEDVTAQTHQAVQTKEQLQGRPLFVQGPKDNTAFNHAFRNFMITNLVNRGIPVTEEPAGAIVIDYSTQIVRYQADRKYSPLLSGVIVARNIKQHSGHSHDLGSTWTYLTDGPTNSELIVTTSILDNGLYALRKSDVYYVDGVDLRLFAPLKPVAKNLKVVGQ